MTDANGTPATALDPRTQLADWANSSDEWVRYIVRQVLSTGRPISTDDVAYAHDLFRQEKSLDERVLPEEPPLEVATGPVEDIQPLTITKLHEVTGVNALTPGAVIEPHAGLTILFGENGTGKTGYSRIFKALADSRTADVILGNIRADTEESQSAKIEYRIGAEGRELTWKGERGKAPFTRMSIFDSPSVNFHVDDDLEYVYVPAVLALFNHVISGIKEVQARGEAAIAELTSGATTLLGRFPKDSAVYPLIETLGAATDLDDLKSRADRDPKFEDRLNVLRQAVAALEANTIGAQVNDRQRAERVLRQAEEICAGLVGFDVTDYNRLLIQRAALEADYKAFRSELFDAADLPAEPEQTWEAFVASGNQYRQHLEGLGVHDAERCLYCRQTLASPARDLINRYAEYLDDKISTDITEVNASIYVLVSELQALATTDVVTYLSEYHDREDKPAFFEPLQQAKARFDGLLESVRDGKQIDATFPRDLKPTADAVASALALVTAELTSLREQVRNRSDALTEKKKELAELTAAAELARSWSTIERQVQNAKQADRLRILLQALPKLSRGVTELSKSASDQLINQNFDNLFVEECAALRAPTLKLQFVGRQGKAQRRKVLSGKHRPSKVLSEGEQKVLAMADFLAEARLAGITAPVIFDDPVSSLDHRRINEVAQRIASLAEDNQVIVFTHDIFFTTTLLALFEKSKRCSYFQITDEAGKGKVTRATGPRWDTLASIKKNINETIQAAKMVDGEARAALVRTGYGWVRSWCEVFTESELLQGVTQRYQPNVGMTRLSNIKVGELPHLIETVTRIFEDACRYIDGHSQPLPTLGVSPTLPGLEEHWKELQDCKKAHDTA